MANLHLELSGIPLRHPIMSASGPPVRNGAQALATAAGGASALVTKTISVTPARLCAPFLAQVGGGLLNAETWSDISKEQWLRKELPMIQSAGLPVIIQLGYTAPQLHELVPMFRDYAQMFELSTHYTGNSLLPILSALETAKKLSDVPVYVKLSPCTDIQNIALALERAGADGLVLCNSFGPCLGIDVESARPVLGSDGAYGWLSGSALHAISLRCVYEAANVVKIPIVGVGGITNGREAAAMLMAGASAVQVCTQAVLEGPSAFGRIAEELNAFMDRKGYRRVSDICGLALGKSGANRWQPGYLEQSADGCVRCHTCVHCCRYGAISIEEGKWSIDKLLCSRCGLCVSRCPQEVLCMSELPTGGKDYAEKHT